MTSDKKASPVLNYIVKTNPDLLSFLREGDLVEAKLLKAESKSAYFDLGKYGTGIVYGREFLNARNIINNLEVGQTISAKVADLENDEGHVELSLAGAYQQKNWEVVKELKESGEVTSIKVVGANSGGLVAEVNGIKAFLPVSQLSNDHYPRVVDADKSKILEELKKLVGQEINVKVLDFNPRASKLIISEKEVEAQNLKDLIANYKVGDVIDGIVSGVADFGAFIRFTDNPAIDGLIHISEIDHKVIDNPKEVIKVDDAVKAKIIEIKDNQIFLSLKALKENPWEKANEFFKGGQEVSGIVYKYNPFGAYINLEHDLQGLIHVSEFGSIEELKKQLEVSKSYQFIVDSIKLEESRINLKIVR